MMRNHPAVLLMATVLVLTAFISSPIQPADQKPKGNDSQTVTKNATLPSGEMVVVTHGAGESANAGSYSIRLYSLSDDDSRPDNFLSGQIRSREGFIDRITIGDLDRDSIPEVVVLIHHADSETNISADAYSITGEYLKFMGTFSDLAVKSEPIVQIRNILKTKVKSNRQFNGRQCINISKIQHIALPAKNENVSISRIKDICKNYGANDLAQKIELDPPEIPFQSDGCSLWFGSWNGTSLYPACFIHDLKYWAGYPEEELERLIADAELMVDIACLTGSTVMAETMFQGTRFGGDEIYKRSFSWGFGRESE